MNAEKMIKSGNYHALSTEDFEILGYFNNKYQRIQNWINILMRKI